MCGYLFIFVLFFFITSVIKVTMVLCQTSEVLRDVRLVPVVSFSFLDTSRRWGRYHAWFLSRRSHWTYFYILSEWSAPSRDQTTSLHREIHNSILAATQLWCVLSSYKSVAVGHISIYMYTKLDLTFTVFCHGQFRKLITSKIALSLYLASFTLVQIWTHYETKTPSVHTARSL